MEVFECFALLVFSGERHAEVPETLPCDRPFHQALRTGSRAAGTVNLDAVISRPLYGSAG